MDRDETRLLLAEFKAYMQWAKTVGIQIPQKNNNAEQTQILSDKALVEPHIITENIEPYDLYQTVSQCKLCHLSQNRALPILGFGNTHAQFVIVVDIPFIQFREKIEKPLDSEKITLLEKILYGIDLSWNDTYLMALTKCPSLTSENAQAKEQAIASCKPYLNTHLQYIKPSVLLSLGELTAQSLLSTRLSIDKLRGRWWNFQGIAVMPTYDIEEIFLSPQKKKSAWNDIKAVKKILSLRKT